MKAKCKKCEYCIMITSDDFIPFKRKVVCQQNSKSMEQNPHCKGNYWGMSIPHYCPYYQEKGMVK